MKGFGEVRGDKAECLPSHVCLGILAEPKILYYCATIMGNNIPVEMKGCRFSFAGGNNLGELLCCGDVALVKTATQLMGRGCYDGPGYTQRLGG